MIDLGPLIGPAMFSSTFLNIYCSGEIFIVIDLGPLIGPAMNISFSGGSVKYLPGQGDHARQLGNA